MLFCYFERNISHVWREIKPYVTFFQKYTYTLMCVLIFSITLLSVSFRLHFVKDVLLLYCISEIHSIHTHIVCPYQIFIKVIGYCLTTNWNSYIVAIERNEIVVLFCIVCCILSELHYFKPKSSLRFLGSASNSLQVTLVPY